MDAKPLESTPEEVMLNTVICSFQVKEATIQSPFLVEGLVDKMLQSEEGV